MINSHLTIGGLFATCFYFEAMLKLPLKNFDIRVYFVYVSFHDFIILDLQIAGCIQVDITIHWHIQIAIYQKFPYKHG